MDTGERAKLLWESLSKEDQLVISHDMKESIGEIIAGDVAKGLRDLNRCLAPFELHAADGADFIGDVMRLRRADLKAPPSAQARQAQN